MVTEALVSEALVSKKVSWVRKDDEGEAVRAMTTGETTEAEPVAEPVAEAVTAAIAAVAEREAEANFFSED